MQEIASSKRGEISNTLEINISIWLVSITKEKKTAPKNVLPASPIKSLAGFQLNKRKHIKDNINGIKVWYSKDKVRKTINRVEVIKPLRQSKKLTKLIIAVPKKERNRITNIFKSVKLIK